VVPVQVIVEHPEVPNSAAALVGQKRIRDPVFRGKRRERRYGVVTDRKQRDIGVGEIGGDTLQLNELRFAVRSPPRTAVENDDRLPAPARLLKAHRRPGLIGQGNVGKPRSDRGTLCVQFL
jgi:hypothetical protein